MFKKFPFISSILNATITFSFAKFIVLYPSPIFDSVYDGFFLKKILQNKYYSYL